MKEYWKPISGYECYEVSDTGKVRRITKGESNRTSGAPYDLKQHKDKDGYLYVILFHPQTIKKKKLRVHRLVAAAFISDHPSGMVACHNNGDKNDNSIGNVRWDTQKGNIADKILHGTQVRGCDAHQSKLSPCQAIYAKYTPLTYRGHITNLAREYGVSRTAINLIRKGRNWSHV